MKTLAVFGAGGHGKVVADIAQQCGWSPVFFDDRWPEMEMNGPWDVLGGLEELTGCLDEYDGVIVAIGDNRTRLNKHFHLKERNAALVSIVHPSAEIGREVLIAAGTVIMPQVSINFATEIGEACILNTGCSIDHDGTLGNGVHVSPGARVAGDVSIEEGTWLGIGAMVIECIKIGKYSVVGAGAVVINNVADHRVVAGVPASYIR